jgi:hypothetical protein
VKGKVTVELAMGPWYHETVINETSGYIVQQGQRMDLTGEPLAEMKKVTVLFEETTLASKAGVTLMVSKELVKKLMLFKMKNNFIL